MAQYNKFNNFVQGMANGTYNLGADALKVMLTNAEPLPTYSTISDITEIPAGNGYVAGGAALAIASSVQIGGVYILLPSGSGIVNFTASGGTVGPFQYPVLYDAATGNLISWYDNEPPPVTLVPGQSFSVAFNLTGGVLQSQ